MGVKKLHWLWLLVLGLLLQVQLGASAVTESTSREQVRSCCGAGCPCVKKTTQVPRQAPSAPAPDFQKFSLSALPSGSDGAIPTPEAPTSVRSSNAHGHVAVHSFPGVSLPVAYCRFLI
jgi:hypothetical protein